MHVCAEMCIAESLLVTIVTVLLHFNFVFLRFATELDSMLFYYLTPKAESTGVAARPVFFIDIDDASMREYFEDDNIYGRSTPRRLQAQLLERLKTAAPAVIIMDFDYREPQADDEYLRQQFLTSESPIIIPRMMYSKPQGACARKANAEDYEVSPRFLAGEFDSLGDGERIFFAQADVESVFGYTFGFCTSVTARNSGGEQERLPAVALLATALGQNKPLDLPPQEGVERFYIRVTDTSAGYADGLLRFKRFPAYFVTAENAIVTHFKDAIIVIGASHSGANDLHNTVEGVMPGGMVVSNAILQMLSGPIVQYDVKEGFLIDILFVVLQSVFICAASYPCKYLIDRVNYYRNLCASSPVGRKKKNTFLAVCYVINIALFLLETILILSIPIFLLWAVHASVLYKIMHVNSYVIILPALLSLLSLFFEGRRELSENIRLIIVRLFDILKNFFVTVKKSVSFALNNSHK